MKYLLPLLLLPAFFSCEKPDVFPIEHKGTYSFVFRNKYAISDIYFYKGGATFGREVITEKQVQDKFNISVNNFNLDGVRIDFSNMILYETKGTACTAYSISISNDSLYYIDNGNHEKEFVGVVTGDKSYYLYFKTYYLYRFQDDKRKIESSGSIRGILSYNDAFKKENLFFSGKEYGFTSPAEMKNKNDVVCWIIVRFILEKR